MFSLLIFSVLMQAICLYLSRFSHFGLYIEAQKISKRLGLPLRGPALSQFIKAHGGPYMFILFGYSLAAVSGLIAAASQI